MHAQKINEKNCFDLPLSSLLRETKQDGEFERASVLLETVGYRQVLVFQLVCVGNR